MSIDAETEAAAADIAIEVKPQPGRSSGSGPGSPGSPGLGSGPGSRQILKTKKRSQFVDVWRRMKKSKTAVIGIILIAIFLGMALFAPLIADYEEDALAMNVRQRLTAPNFDHWFGTDEFGRDIFARIVYGTRISLFVGVISVSIALSVGGTLGAIAGYYGGKIDNAIMRVLDVLLAIPTILLAITIVAALGASILNLMIAVGISNIPGFARVVRASVLSVKDQEFIEAARAIGAKDHVIIPQACAPHLDGSDRCFRHPEGCIGYHGHLFAQLYRAGNPAADPRVGNMPAGGRAYIRDHKVHCTLSGAGHRAHRPLAQPDRRRTAGCPRSQTQITEVLAGGKSDVLIRGNFLKGMGIMNQKVLK